MRHTDTPKASVKLVFYTYAGYSYPEDTAVVDVTMQAKPSVEYVKVDMGVSPSTWNPWTTEEVGDYTVPAYIPADKIRYTYLSEKETVGKPGRLKKVARRKD